jgi:hypothetical protein
VGQLLTVELALADAVLDRVPHAQLALCEDELTEVDEIPVAATAVDSSEDSWVVKGASRESSTCPATEIVHPFV